jgi:hypothetical protein
MTGQNIVMVKIVMHEAGQILVCQREEADFETAYSKI